MIRAWCGLPDSTYEDLGRPTLVAPGEKRGHTLDFTLRHRETRRTYVAEMKCEIQFEGFRYLELTSGDQLKRHEAGAAFSKFIQVAREPAGSLTVRVGGQPTAVDGAILVWGGAVSQGGREAVGHEYPFADIVSVEEAAADLAKRRPKAWSDRVHEMQRWSNELFDMLAPR